MRSNVGRCAWLCALPLILKRGVGLLRLGTRFWTLLLHVNASASISKKTQHSRQDRHRAEAMCAAFFHTHIRDLVDSTRGSISFIRGDIPGYNGMPLRFRFKGSLAWKLWCLGVAERPVLTPRNSVAIRRAWYDIRQIVWLEVLSMEIGRSKATSPPGAEAGKSNVNVTQALYMIS